MVHGNGTARRSKAEERQRIETNGFEKELLSKDRLWKGRAEKRSALQRNGIEWSRIEQRRRSGELYRNGKAMKSRAMERRGVTTQWSSSAVIAKHGNGNATKSILMHCTKY